MQRAIPLEEQVEFDLPKGSQFSAALRPQKKSLRASQVWTLRQADDPVIQEQKHEQPVDKA